jgi:hypothetical protein
MSATTACIRTPFFGLLLTALLLGSACADPPERVDDNPGGADSDLPIGEGSGDGDGDTQMGDGDGDVVIGDGDGDVADPVYSLTVVTGAVQLIAGETAEVTLQVVDEDGAAVEGATISLALDNTSASLSATSTITTSTGRAQVEVQGVSAGGATLTATTPYAQALTVPVTVQIPPYGTVNVSLVDETRIEVTGTTLFAWFGNTAPSCASVADGAAGPASTQVNVGQIPTTYQLTDVAHGAEVTLVAVTYGADDLVVASACRDGLAVAGGQSTNATLTLTQNPTVLDGDYDVLMHLELGDALPEPYETYVGTATAVLSDPAGYAAYQALKAVDNQLGTSFIAWEQAAVQPYASYDEVSSNPGVFGTWSLARDYLDAELASRLGQPYDDVTTVGGDLRDVVTDFEVGSRFEITETAPGEVQVTERWNALVFEWHLGCADGDEGCARRPVETDDLQLSATDVTYGGLVDRIPSDTETERFLLRGNAHSMSFRYGAVVTAAMEQVVFPSLPGGLAADDLAGVLGNLIDCAEVGAALANAIGFGGAGMYEGFCDTGIALAANEIENQVVALELGDDNPQLAAKDHEGAFSGGQLYLIDADHNLVAEQVREFSWLIAWNDPTDPFVSLDIQVPMTGEGRWAASRCTSDAACDAGESCQPIAHYLKVQNAEMDCLEAVGSLGGEQACSSDSQCASGLCVTDQDGVNVCFAACTSGDTCSLGSCGPAADLVDLDPVMDGLGGATAMACGMAPSAPGTGGSNNNGGMCTDTCQWANDGVCDDGGPGSEYSVCGLGTDCGDCGAR